MVLRKFTPIKLNGFDNEKVVHISCGCYHSIVLTESGRAFSWGHNYYGELGYEIELAQTNQNLSN
jgi:alpha-tubulin suppressor-like RCC1 family protein